MADKFRLNRKGVAEVLRSQCGDAVNALAEQVAAAARSEIGDDSVPVEVNQYTTDRGAAAVVIAHPSGAELQARGGVLTRAASSAGLEVVAK
ncbi:MAG: hypothetical protein WBA98_03745 [Gordonia sp. (in: high G+C Gram-positive bacteria)]|uniref:hypothetical protein n=1 Tax=Gordonia sp. (in: high G+C Gram-positive bacteria) TaxID=84139 RepID=UPI003C773D4D